MFLKSFISLGHPQLGRLSLGYLSLDKYFRLGRGLAITVASLAVGLGAAFEPATAATFTTELEPQPIGTPQSLSTLPKYQPQSGEELLGVTIELSGSVNGQVEIDNPTLRSQTVRVNIGGTLTLLGPLSQPLLTVSPNTATTQTIEAGTPTIWLTSLEAVTPTLSEGASAITLSAQTPYVMDNFIGDGFLDFQLSSADTSSIQGSSTLESKFLNQAKATVRVSYNTRPDLPQSPDLPKPVDIPEPSIVLGLTFLIGSDLVIKKTRNSKVR